LLVGEAATLRISIWDFGGQRIFQSVQHLLIVRRAVYFVVFNMETFIHNRDSSFSFLDFWIHTIVIQARDAPIFLFGTRGDLVNSTKHKEISSALELRYAKIIGENPIEKNGDLYFFPVDNTSVDVEKFKDISVRTEKRILTDKLQPVIKVAPSEQPIPYVEDKMPIPWIDFFDKLKLMASRSDEDHDPVSYLAAGNGKILV
jgi:GTPase SAR1 family protein